MTMSEDKQGLNIRPVAMNVADVVRFLQIDCVIISAAYFTQIACERLLNIYR